MNMKGKLHERMYDVAVVDDRKDAESIEQGRAYTSPIWHTP